MRFFGGGGDPRSTSRAESTTVEQEDQVHSNRIDHQSPTSSGTHTTTASPAGTISLNREYTLAVQTSSYNEIWSKIHHQPGPVGAEEEEAAASVSCSPAQLVLERVLQPDADSIHEALRAARPTQLTRLVSNYLDSSERTSRLFVSLRLSVDRARSLYGPIGDLIHLIPATPTAATDSATHPHLSPAQCTWAYDTFLEFNRLDNPFPSLSGDCGESCSFDAMRSCFAELKQQLDRQLQKTRQRHLLLRRVTHGSAACLVASVAGLAVAGLAIATHALAVLVAFAGCLLPPPMPMWDLLGDRRQRLREHMARLDAAARGAYVLDNHLDTIECLVSRLHATVESDKVLMRLGLERGRGERHPIEEVVRHLRKNHVSLLYQLRDLDEHVCLCFAAVNRARSLLLQQIHNHTS